MLADAHLYLFLCLQQQFNLSIPEDRSAQKMFNEVIVKDGVINFNQPILINFFVRYRSTRTQIESWCISMHQIK